jgi:hypothetical protein
MTTPATRASNDAVGYPFKPKPYPYYLGEGMDYPLKHIDMGRVEKGNAHIHPYVV